MTCPYCLGQWIATAFVVGLKVSPRLTRFIASIFTVVTAADFLHAARIAVEERT